MRTFLGIDPGQTTGLAVVQVGDRAPYVVPWVRSVPLAEIAGVFGTLGLRLDGVVIEGWEYQGSARARGVAPQAYATGFCRGLTKMLGTLDAPAPRVVEMPRTAILRGLGCGRTASKAQVRDALRGLVRVPDVGAHAVTPTHLDEHAWDAIAAAVVGAGRI